MICPDITEEQKIELYSDISSMKSKYYRMRVEHCDFT